MSDKQIDPAGRDAPVGKQPAALVEQPSAHTDLPQRLEQFVSFLCGAAELDGASFGDRLPSLMGAYWWRTPLRTLEKEIVAALAAHPVRESPSESAREALDCIFRENAVPMSDRNGRLYDMVAAASGGAEPAVKVCCQQFGTCREPCCSRADYWQGRTEQLLREQGIPTVGAQVGAGSVVEPPAPQVKALAPGEFTFPDNSGLSTVCPWCENGFTILLPGDSPAVAAPPEPLAWFVDANEHATWTMKPDWFQVWPGDPMWSDNWKRYPLRAPAEQPTDTQDSGEMT